MFFVFLGNLGNSKSLGTNNLIKEFAHIVTTPEDILVKYGFLEPCKDYMDKAKDTNQVDNIPKEYVDIFKVITEEPIVSRLTMLELEGKIKKVAGNRYVKGDR